MPRRFPRPTRTALTKVAALAMTAGLTLGACSSSGTSNSSSPSGSAGTGGSTPGTAAGGAPDASGALSLGSPTSWSTVAAPDGRTFVSDSQGRALQLRGFNIKTREPAADASDELLAAGAQRGFNVLRLSIYWDQFEPEQDRYDEAYLAQVQTVLDRAATHGIYVVLDFHQDVFGAAFGDHGIPTWATRDDGIPYQRQDVWLMNYLQPAVQAAWGHLYDDPDIRQWQIDAWTEIAKRFKDEPALVGYDLLNEPFGKLGGGESIADAASRVQREQITPMYQRLSDAIGQVDPGHWILFEPPNVASIGVPVALGPVEGDRLIYFPHFYDPAIETATYTPGGQIDGFDPAFFASYEQAIKTYPLEHGYPMWWGEWGIAHPEKPGMDAFVDQSLDLMDRLGSGWTVFNWCKGDGYCPLDEAGKDRPAIGQIVRPYARAIAGVPVSFAYDDQTKVLKVVFTDGDATGTTDLVVPASAYPSGWGLSASDAEGSWSSSEIAPSTNGGPTLVRVTTPKGAGPHAVCLAPKGTAATCAP